jgi:hypothetical protein
MEGRNVGRGAMGIAKQGGIEHRTKARATIAERISNLFVYQRKCWDSEKSHFAPDAAYKPDAPGAGPDRRIKGRHNEHSIYILHTAHNCCMTHLSRIKAR